MNERSDPDPPRSWRFPATQTWNTRAGLRVVLCPLDGQPMISLDLVLPGQITAEPDGLDGITALLAAALPASVPGDGPDGAIGAAIESVTDPAGLRLRAFCTGRTLAATLGSMAAMVATGISDERAAALIKVHASRRLGYVSVVNELRAALFGRDSRLGRPWHGTPDTLSRITPADLREFYLARVRPERAVLVVAGDIDRAALDRRLADAFAGWSGPGGLASADRHGADRHEPDHGAAGLPERRLVLLDRPEYEQVQLMMGAVVPGPGHRAWPALLSAIYLLGGAQLSPLDLALREQHGYTFGLRTSLTLIPGGAIAVIRTFLSTEHAAAALAELTGYLARLQAEGCTDATAARVVRAMAGAAPRNLQTSRAVGNAIAEAVIHRLPDTYPAALQEVFRQVTTADIGQVAARQLSRDRWVTVLSGPAADIGTVAAEAASCCPAGWFPATAPAGSGG